MVFGLELDLRVGQAARTPVHPHAVLPSFIESLSILMEPTRETGAYTQHQCEGIARIPRLSALPLPLPWADRAI